MSLFDLMADNEEDLFGYDDNRVEEPRKFFRMSDGTFIDDGSYLSCVMYFDKYGAYLGQEQMNCMDEDGPATLFFKATGNQAGEFGLTEEEMAGAIEWEKRYSR